MAMSPARNTRLPGHAPSNGSPDATDLRTQLQARWNALQARERSALSLVAVVVAVALIWLVAVAPALRTLERAPARLAKAQAAVQRVLTLREEANGLRGNAAAALPRTQALEVMERASQRVAGDTVQWQHQADQSTLQLRAVPPRALADLLTTLRSSAHVTPTQAQLTKNSDGNWSGSLSFVPPAR